MLVSASSCVVGAPCRSRRHPRRAAGPCTSSSAATPPTPPPLPPPSAPPRNARLTAPRRTALVSAAVLSLVFAPLLEHAAAADEEYDAFVGVGGAYTLERPSSWLLAYDRADDGKPAQTLVLIGRLREGDTISVRREPVPEGVVLDGSVPAAQVAEQLLPSVVLGQGSDGVISAPGLLGLQLVASGVRETGGRYYYSVEEKTELCRGRNEEAKGGAVRCAGFDGSTIDTVTRHSITVAVAAPRRPGFIYVLRASTAEARWPEVSAALRRAADTFTVQ